MACQDHDNYCIVTLSILLFTIVLSFVYRNLGSNSIVNISNDSFSSLPNLVIL